MIQVVTTLTSDVSQNVNNTRDRSTSGLIPTRLHLRAGAAMAALSQRKMLVLVSLAMAVPTSSAAPGGKGTGGVKLKKREEEIAVLTNQPSVGLACIRHRPTDLNSTACERWCFAEGNTVTARAHCDWCKCTACKFCLAYRNEEDDTRVGAAVAATAKQSTAAQEPTAVHLPPPPSLPPPPPPLPSPPSPPPPRSP
eukprot:2114937-Pleurochrysis_carterae.AAC.1